MHAYSQSFEEVSVPHLSTSPTASRSAHFVDVNGDSYDDIFITNGLREGQNNNLYINQKDGTFSQITSGDIVADDDRSVGASFADADNDGDLDVVVTTFGQFGSAKKNYFYLNDGNGVFDHQTQSTISTTGTYSEMVNWIDANGDEQLDVLITNSVLVKKNPFFLGMGDGTFSPSQSTAFNATSEPSRSVDWVDYNNDGFTDIFITNEEGRRNELYKNLGGGNFERITDVAIVTEFDNAVGSSWGDIDNDGDFDVFIATYSNTGGARNKLYRNIGNGQFEKITDSEVAALRRNSFGSSFADVDNDGDLDLFVCNSYLSSVQNNDLYINDGSGNFSKDVTSALATYTGHTFGCAFGDYNKDGWQDLVLANNKDDNQTNALFKNTGSGNHFIAFNLQGTTSNSYGVGAIVIVEAKINGEWVKQHRFVSAASGYCSQNTYTVHFGLGDAEDIAEVTVVWPSGEVDNVFNVSADQHYTIVELGGISSTVDQKKERGVSVFPNPAEDSIQLVVPNSWKESIDRISIINERQQLVHQAKWSGNDIDVSSLASGLYIIQLLGTDGTIVGTPFIKK